jgi:hypothetical protein
MQKPHHGLGFVWAGSPQTPCHSQFQSQDFSSVFWIPQVLSSYRYFAHTPSPAPDLQPLFGYLIPTDSSDLTYGEVFLM